MRSIPSVTDRNLVRLGAGMRRTPVTRPASAPAASATRPVKTPAAVADSGRVRLGAGMRRRG
jgi:hypothetical protein